MCHGYTVQLGKGSRLSDQACRDVLEENRQLAASRAPTSNQSQNCCFTERSMPGTCSDFQQHLGPLWSAALQPPFIKGCVDGSITQGQFNTWLKQVCSIECMGSCDGRQ